MKLHQKMKHLREQKGYTTHDLANITGLSKSYIWDLENRPRINPTAEKVYKIAKALGVTVEFLINDHAQDPTDILTYSLYNTFKQLTEEQKQEIFDLIKSWSKPPVPEKPKQEPRQKLNECPICNKRTPWDKNWRHTMLENDDVYKVCSDDCEVEMLSRLRKKYEYYDDNPESDI